MICIKIFFYYHFYRRIITVIGVLTLSFLLFSSPQIFTLAYSLLLDDDEVFNFLGPLSYALLFLNSLINPVLFLTVSTPAQIALKKTLYC